MDTVSLVIYGDQLPRSQVVIIAPIGKKSMKVLQRSIYGKKS
ncbi:hypothetical protein QVL63_03535 [Bartonella henselae]|nr:hypothetical protein [Bartonella henselae]MDM9984849.1 hypothetical protein [Bartonella henselae]MDM9995217.1 hypothetical protein [Bartonella henselae]